MNLFERIRATLTDQQRRDNAWWGRAWTRLTDWLVVVTWKRLFVVVMLMLIAGGLLSALFEEAFFKTQRTVEVSTQEQTKPKNGKKTKIVISADEKGVRVHTEPEDTERMPAEPPVPPVPTVPPVPSEPAAPEASDSVGLDAGKIGRDLGEQGRKLGEQGRKLGEEGRKLADAARKTAEQARKNAEVIKERNGVQIVVDAEKGLPQDVQELLEEIKTSIEESNEDEEPVVSKKTIVSKVKPSAGALIMNTVALMVFGLIALKVIMNTQRKAQAKVAVAEEATERETLKRQLTEARLTTMQAQVEPHFLFNTLASVDHLIEVAPQRASQMQKSLIQYLRAAMPHMRETNSNMAREAQLATSYLEILKFRMEERLEFSVDVPAGLGSAEIPPMMLLSLVENAIKHGLEPKPEGGRVDLKAEIVDGKLRVIVADTGLGYSPKNSTTRGTGVGLANINERLAMLYPGKAQLLVTANQPSGTLCTIELPYRVSTKTGSL